MSSKLKVLILGGTGETGEDIVHGLLSDGSYEVSVFTRPTSASGPQVAALKDRRVHVVVGDLRAPAAELAAHLENIDVLISALGANAQHEQYRWADAAKIAQVKRFVPCGFTTVSPRGDIMMIRDEKELVHDHVFRIGIPFTIIDVGYWHQISFPSLPSGKADYAMFIPNTEIYSDGNTPSLLTDKRDIGHFVARIIKDPRTLNKRVVTWSDELSQNQIWNTMERLSGETIPRTHVSAADALSRVEKAREALRTSNPPNGWQQRIGVFGAEYNYSKYVRGDNTLENAKYLGYLDARELYPDFKPVSFEEYIQELLAGKAKKVPGGNPMEIFAKRLGGENAVH